MKRSFTKYIFGLIGLFLCSCIRNVTVPIRSVPPIIVVEGWITTDPPPYSINLSYSGKFTSTYQGGTDSVKQQFITDARVTIEDDLGDSTTCIRSVNGTYLSSDSNFIGFVGRTYTLKIYLSNGKTYQSKPEKIMPVPPIDSVSVVYDSSYVTDIRPTQFVISVNTHDPPSVPNYYRWTASGYIPRKSWGNLCTYPYPPCTDPFSCSCFALCEQFLNNGEINVLSDQFIDGREITEQPVFYSPVYWFGVHYIEIKQHSISQGAYLFWEQYLTQTNRTGSILDPLPAQLAGNIYNQADSNDIALGLFSVSAVYTKKLIIVPFFLQTYLLESIAGSYDQQGNCQLTYPNALNDDAVPPGWENAQVINFR
jgi:Domain of unknown function (DUF4249)